MCRSMVCSDLMAVQLQQSLMFMMFGLFCSSHVLYQPCCGTWAQQTPATRSQRSPAMVDRAVYAQGTKPSQAVSQICARAKVPADVCIRFAVTDLRTVEMISVLGENHEKVRLSFTRISGGDQALGADDQEREKTLLWACVVWTACSKLHEVSSVQRAKMESDPHIIPSLPQDDVADFRSRFVLSHPDVILLPCREPHKKFVERLHRDFTIDSMVPC